MYSIHVLLFVVDLYFICIKLREILRMSYSEKRLNVSMDLESLMSLVQRAKDPYEGK